MLLLVILCVPDMENILSQPVIHPDRSSGQKEFFIQYGKNNPTSSGGLSGTKANNLRVRNPKTV